MKVKKKATGGKPVAETEISTGGPISSTHFSSNGHSTQGLQSLADLLDQNLITPEQAAAEAEQSSLLAYTVRAIEELADLPEGLQILAYLKPLIEQLDPAEREKLTTPLYSVLKSKKNVDAFVESLSKPRTGPVFTPLSLDELLAMPPKEWLIDQVIGAQDIAMVYGPPGSGKTFLVIDLVLAACTGSQWAMRFDVTRPLSVAYCAGEGVSGLPARFKATAEFREIDPRNLPNFFFYQTVPQLYHKESGNSPLPAEHVIRFIKEWQERDQSAPIDLLVVDTLHAATVGAEENSASDMGLVLQAVRYASRELGCAVLLVHHTNKSGSAERGSSALRGAMDAMISVKKVSEESTSSKGVIQCEKLKDGEGWKPQTFDLTALSESVRVWWDKPAELSQAQGKQRQDKEALLQVMTEHPGVKFTAKRLGEAIGMGENKQIYKLLNSLQSEDACKRELQNPEKSSSPYNPWLYFVESQAEGEGEQ